VFVMPEYNSGFGAALKNVLDDLDTVGLASQGTPESSVTTRTLAKPEYAAHRVGLTARV
jgi:NAD(P)H-dependent FMN reductase